MHTNSQKILRRLAYVEPLTEVAPSANSKPMPQRYWRKTRAKANHIPSSAWTLNERNLENKMMKALENQDFCVYYQPKYDTQSRTFTGAETLVRWIDPEWGLIYPGSFVPLFESNGIITELDCVVFSEVCGQICRWLDAGLPVGTVSVNVSRLHLYHPHFTEEYQSILAHHGIPTRLIQPGYTGYRRPPASGRFCCSDGRLWDGVFLPEPVQRPVR